MRVSESLQPVSPYRGVKTGQKVRRSLAEIYGDKLEAEINGEEGDKTNF